MLFVNDRSSFPGEPAENDLYWGQRGHTGAPENGCVGTSGQRCAANAIRCGVVDDNETILLAEAYGQASIGVMKA